MKPAGIIYKIARELYDALKLAEMVIQADLNTLDLQHIERESNELILEIMRRAIRLFERVDDDGGGSKPFDVTDDGHHPECLDPKNCDCLTNPDLLKHQ